MPDAGTQRAALKLTELFGNDRSIIIELFGEPFGPTWNAYLNGGTVSGKQYVGINQIIASMRSAGSRNVVIVNALGQDYSKYLNQSQRFSDSLGQLAYGVHTYFSMVGHSQAGVPGVDNHGGWDSNYGNFATTHPTLVTEWNQNTLRAGNTTEEWCTVVPLDMPLKAFHYFKDKKLNGAVGWSFDLTTTIVKDLIGTPRTLEGFACGQSGGGIGRLFQQYFLGTLPAALSHGDRVKTTAILNVRATPSGSGTKVGTVPLGSLCTIVGGPTKTANYTFWQIDWDRGISGWSVERYLEKVITPTGTSCTLTASPASITAGNSSTLSWTSTNATSGTINQGVGAMTPIAAGTKSVSPTSSTLYTATVTGAGGSATCSARVGVGVTPPPSNDVITVQGNKILRNGQPFIMKGVVFESSQYTDADLAFCSSPGHTDEVSCKKRKDSRDYYFARGAFASGNDVFSVLPQWGANTIRLNLGQALLDPQSPYYDSAYVQMVADSVKRARDRGYIVIVSPFAGRNDRAGVYLNSHNPDTPLDSASTLRANETLAGLFKNDRGVIFETLNEPYWTHNATGWGYWLNGGTNVGPNGWNFVGVNTVISAVRATGARNVIIAQGIGASFEGFPGGVIDSAGQLAYSAHPFLNKGPYESDWQARFGTFAATHPFLITAWGSNTNDDWCANTATDISRPLEFLNYLKQRDIGLAGWAFDASGAGSITKDFNTNPGAPSVLGAKCGDNGGVGTLVQQYFLGTLPPLAPTFSPGDRIRATAILNVRGTPSGSGTRVGTVPLASLGTIVGGPTKTANYTFWQIDWDSRISGWSVELYLAKTSTSTDTTLPTVSLTAPAASSTVSSTVTLSANASDNVGVTGVQFKVDGANVGAEDTTAPYSISWNTTTVTNGTHTIKAVAKDAAGNTRSTAGRSVTVVNGTADNTKPTVSLTAPADGATISGNVTISANASDNVGVVGVQFKVDGANVGAEDTSAPYSIVWDSTTVTNGNHNIRAVARDAAGNTQWSALKKATVSNTVYGPRSVIHDPTYQSGFSVRTPESVLSYTTSNLYPFGNNNNSKPEWSSGQWGSQYPFSSTTPKTVLASGAVEYKTPGKRIVLGPGDYVLLGLNSSDWGSHIQRLGTASPVKGFLSLDPEQHRQDDIPISQLESVQYKMSFRLIKAETGGPGSGGAHAQANLRLVNNNPSSPGYKEWVYFIIKLYDNRYRTISYQLKKDGGTGALLYRLPSSDFYGNKSAWDMKWITIDKDILPMFAKAIQTGYSKGYLKSNNLGDYVPRFTGVHWEMTALKSVEME